MDRFPFSPDAIRMLADILIEKGLSEIELVSRDNRIRVTQINGEVQTAQAGAANPRQTPAAQGSARPVAAEKESQPANQPGAVLSPMVGIVYLSPEPDAPPFVSAGQKVEAGQTLMLVEAMKSFTPITAPVSGTVTRILAENGETVEYGETLMVVE